MTTMFGLEGVFRPQHDKRVRRLVSFVRDGRYPDVPAPIAAVVAALDQLDALEAAPRSGMNEFCDDLVDAATAGRRLPEDLGVAALQAQREEQVEAAAREALAGAKDKLVKRTLPVVRAHLADLLTGLRAEIESALEAGGQTLEAIGGIDITSAEAAVAATDPQRKALSKLQAAQLRYESAREAQRVALLAVDVSVAEALDKGLHEFSDVRLQGTPSTGHDPRVRFLEVLRRRDVWVPTLEQLFDTHSELMSVGMRHTQPVGA